MKYKALFFDLDETLIDYNKSHDLAIKKLHERYFSCFCTLENFNQVYVKINDPLWEDLHKGKLALSFLKIERFKNLIDHFSLDYSPKKLSEYYENKIVETFFWLEGAKKALFDLHKSYSIGIITNGLTKIQKSRLIISGISSISSCSLISEEIKIAKPDKRIFEIGLKKLNLHPHETLMIGDNLESDYQGAINAQMDFCWINAIEKPLPKDLRAPKYILPSIKYLSQNLQES
jgi:YjjG family noncanonical pyrimidine nucleotidase